MAALPHRAHVVEPCARYEQSRRRVGHPARLKRLQLLGQIEAELMAGDDRVGALDGHELIGRQDARGVRLERLRQRRQLGRGQA